MKKEDLYRAIGEIDEQQIAEAQSYRKPHNWAKWGALAACLCLIAAIPILALQNRDAAPTASEPPAEAPGSPAPGEPASPAPPADAPAAPSEPAGDNHGGPPHFVLDGRTYLISSYLTVTNSLPEGFLADGTVLIDGTSEHTCYRNPEVPEWIYVSQQVRTTGELDATGTAIPAEPHEAYVRYVDERLRGKDLLCIDGEMYISMWSAASYGDTPDVTGEYYDAMEAAYGIRIEGTPPEGFLLVGTAEFTGHDTIPAGALASNTEAAEVYCDPDAPEVALVATSWHTAPSTGQTFHEGFNIYIRYDCPLQ